MNKLNLPHVAFWFLLIFNLWHNSIRGVWNFSVRDSLNMNSNVMALAQSIDPLIRIHKPYDGAFYYAMAVDPLLLTDRGLRYIDEPAYRCKRVLYPLAAYVLALGDARRLPYTMLLVNVAAWFFLGWVAWKTASLLGVSRVLLVTAAMTTTGITFSVFRSMGEPLAFALAFWGCYLWESERPWAAVAAFALAGLAREAMLFIPLNILFYEIVFRRNKSPLVSLRLLLGFLPLAGWVLYMKSRLAPVPYNELQWIQVPFVGFYKVAMNAFEVCKTSTDLQRTLSLSVITVVLTLLAVYFFFRNRTLWVWLALSQALFCYLVRGYAIWDFHSGSCRAIIPLMIFSSVYLLVQAKNPKLTTSWRGRIVA